jgi:RNA polymerase sigma-70 factor (ECF subfamily)
VNIEEQVAQLFEETRSDVYRYLVTLGLDPGQAQEAAQDVYLRLYVALKKADDIRNLRAWIFRVAHNLGVRLRSRESTWRPLDPELEARLPDPGENPERIAIERQQKLCLHRAVHTLSPQQQQCLYLRAEGFRYREIASILGISDSSVGEFLRRAIARLREATHE